MLADCPHEMGVGHFPTLHYMNMSQTDLFDRYMKTIEKLYSFETIRQKGEALFSNGAFTRKGGELSCTHEGQAHTDRLEGVFIYFGC